MYFIKTVSQMQDGEPQLGEVTEFELVAKKYEVEDYILSKVLEEDFVHSEYEISNPNGDTAIIETSDYIDYDLVYDYLSEADKINMSTLYVKADVPAPKDR